MVVKRDTMGRQAYESIRLAIVEGRYAPGTKLVVRPLSDELGLSPTPIKEALAVLAREGLLEPLPHRGYFVPTFDVDDIKDICALRVALDRLAAELAAGQPERDAFSDRLDANIERQREAIESGDLQGYADLNNEFHRGVCEASSNGRLIHAADSLFGQIRLLVKSSSGVPGRPSESVAEHEAIAAALRRGDSRTAARLSVQHACRSEAALLRNLALPASRDTA